MTRPLVLDDVVLLDGTGAPPRPSARVVVDGGVIVSVGRTSGPHQGGMVVEGRGRWLLPGLWDTHIHSVFSAGGCVWPEEFAEQQRPANWQAYLRNGITSVVSVADEMDVVLAARAAAREGDLTAPRVFAAGPALTAPGGYPVATILRGELERFRNMAVEVGDPADGRRPVRRLVQEDGVNLTKVVYSTIPGNVPRLGSDVLGALIDEAHLLDRRIFAHVATPGGGHGLHRRRRGRARAHGHRQPPSARARLFGGGRARRFLDATLCLFDKMAHDGDEGYIEGYRPEGSVTRTVLESLRDPAAWWSEPDPDIPSPPWSQTVELTGQAHRAGVRLPLGTDSGNPAVFHGLAAHRELELLVQAGLTPLEALAAATTVAAAKVCAEHRLGTVEPGKEADLVALSDSPIDDIQDTRRVELVVKRGELFDPADMVVA